MVGGGAVPHVQKSSATSWMALVSTIQKLVSVAFFFCSAVRERVPGQTSPHLCPS
jgi:hypothetical protein